jgi:hypothetical protein
VQIGIANIGCATMHSAFNEELPDAVNAMLDSHTVAVSMYVAQFPKWQRFIENAASIELDSGDIEIIRDVTNKLVDELKKETEIVDPDVPKTLAELNAFIADPVNTSKRVAFAVLRSLENMLIKIFSYGADVMEQTAKKAAGDLSSAASKALVVTLLGLAVSGAVKIVPLAGSSQELIWLQNAVDIVRRQIEMIKQ